MLDRRRASHCLIVVCALLMTACDLVVRNGGELRAANAGTIFGSLGSGDTPARPAITLLPGGTVVVEDATVLGGGRSVVSADPIAGSSAPAIRVEGGRLVLQQGTIRGGTLQFLGPDLGRGATENSVGFTGAAIAGRNVRLEISGGLVLGGDVVVMGDPIGSGLSFGGALSAAGPALSLRDSEILISGGTFQLGAKQFLTAFSPRPLFEVDRSAVSIRGGDFRGGPIDLGASQNRIAGGRFEFGIIAGSFNRFIFDTSARPPGCTEIRAGVIPRVEVAGNETAFVFGSGFNLPLGEVDFPTDAEIGFPNSIRLGPFIAGRSVELSGVYENGSPFMVLASVDEGSRLVLVSPGQPGCPS